MSRCEEMVEIVVQFPLSFPQEHQITKVLDYLGEEMEIILGNYRGFAPIWASPEKVVVYMTAMLSQTELNRAICVSDGHGFEEYRYTLKG